MCQKVVRPKSPLSDRSVICQVVQSPVLPIPRISTHQANAPGKPARSTLSLRHPTRMLRGPDVQHLGAQSAPCLRERPGGLPKPHSQELRQHRHRRLEAREHPYLPFSNRDARSPHGVVPLFPQRGLGDSLRAAMPANAQNLKRHALLGPPEVRPNGRRPKAAPRLNGDLDPTVHEWLWQTKAARVTRAERQGIRLSLERRCQALGHQRKRPSDRPCSGSARHRIQIV